MKMTSTTVTARRVDTSELLMLPRSSRPLFGFDLEQWRGEVDLSKPDAANAFGFHNQVKYDAFARWTVPLPVETELLLRIYFEYPGPRAWTAYKMNELYELMYADSLRVFRNTEYEEQARVDLQTRFTALFGRSSYRKYDWIEHAEAKTVRLNDRMRALLSKLKTVPQPASVLERIALHVNRLRGNDIDAKHPIPTLQAPPIRKKPGRPRKQV